MKGVVLDTSWKSLYVHGFDLRATLESGQFFRYYTHDDGYILVTQGVVLRVRQEKDVLYFCGAGQDFVTNFFGLNEHHTTACERLSRDPVLAPLVQKYSYLRIMNIDLHETILGFICSSQSNIPKIRMNLHLLARLCGGPVHDHYILPPPGVLLELQTVLAAKTGYRAKYLIGANRMLSNAVLREIKSGDYQTSHELLCTLPGVGPKIADRICLFALRHGEAFPVDVHVLRAMRQLFMRSRLTNEKKAKLFAQKRWGADAGLAQQFIFQWARDTLSAKDNITTKRASSIAKRKEL